MMRRIFSIVLFFGIVSFVNAQSLAQNIDVVEVADETAISLGWETTFKDAVVKAKTEKKPILIYFTGSDWCGPCIRLEKSFFQTDKFKDFSDKNIVLYKADFPRNADLVTAENKAINKELSIRYSQSSFPTMIVVNEKGEVLGRKNGIYMSEYYYPFLEEITKKYN